MRNHVPQLPVPKSTSTFRHTSGFELARCDTIPAVPAGAVFTFTSGVHLWSTPMLVDRATSVVEREAQF